MRLDFEASGKTYDVIGDPSWLKQCILIMVDNAVKFSAPGDLVSVTIKSDKSEGQHYCYIEVLDQGPGIEEAALPHVFERYYQSEEGKGREGSSGLGLAVAKWIIDGHDGAVWAENRRATKGAKFIIKLKQKT